MQEGVHVQDLVAESLKSESVSAPPKWKLCTDATPSREKLLFSSLNSSSIVGVAAASETSRLFVSNFRGAVRGQLVILNISTFLEEMFFG